MAKPRIQSGPKSRMKESQGELMYNPFPEDQSIGEIPVQIYNILGNHQEQVG